VQKKAGVFARKVQVLREGSGLSQVAFGKVVGVKPWTLRTWEQGRYEPGYPELILEALQARVEKAKGGRT
jgi:DNA-binding transcriptional regulator YiaG